MLGLLDHSKIDLGDELVCDVRLETLSQILLHLLGPATYLRSLLPLSAENFKVLTMFTLLHILHDLLTALLLAQRFIAGVAVHLNFIPDLVEDVKNINIQKKILNLF